MFEEQITESIEAGAPDITYSGNEGPKSPQQEQQMQMAQAQEDYKNYVMGQEEAGGEILPFEQWLRMTYEASRQGAAYGGIMGLDGRKQYGFGSWAKKKIRNLIPNEVADIAVKAAPFVAMVPGWGPAAAGAMRGIGRFDQRGSISDALKQGLGTYAGGKLFNKGMTSAGFREQGASGIGEFFKSAGPSTQQQALADASKNLGSAVDPTGQYAEAMVGDGMSRAADPTGILSEGLTGGNIADTKKSEGIMAAMKKNLGLDKIKEYGVSALNLAKKHPYLTIAGTSAIAGLMASGPDETIDEIMSRGDGYDMDDIRTRVTAAFKDPSGKLLEELRIEFPYLGTKDSKNTAIMADGGRARYGLGNLVSATSVASPNGEASAPSGGGMGGMLGKMIQNNPNIFKNLGQSSGRGPGGGPMPMGLPMPPSGNYADNFIDNKRQFTASPNGEASAPSGDGMGGMLAQLINQNKGMFAAASQNTTPGIDQETSAMILDMNSKGMDIDTISQITQQDAATINSVLSSQNQNAYGGRIGRAEGGLMNLGGMELDYRAEGGFVPIGEYEKKDDVPARLSVNEFVFTADAVRNAGGGDIDQGAEIMERVMKNLEQGGQISEETQGMNGAQEMFNVSERLSEVV